MHNPSLRMTILRERDDARRDEGLRPAFEAYRLNRQVEVYKDMLIPADAWKRLEAREAPPRQGRPIVGLDLGSERSWSAAWAIWPNGRSECYGDGRLLGSLVDSPEKPGINRRNFNAPLARLDTKHPRRREWMESSTRAIGFHSRRATRRRHPWASRWMSQREIRQRQVRSRLRPPPFLFGQRRHHSMVASNWLNSGVFWGYTREFPGTETRLSAP